MRNRITFEIIFEINLVFYFAYNHVGKYSRAAAISRNKFEIISGKFTRAEIELFQTDVDEG